MKLDRLDIDGGIAGTEATLAIMFQLIQHGQIDPVVMAFTDRAVGRTPAHRDKAQVRKVARAWNRHVVVREDPIRHEFIRSPKQTLIREAGDCDDLAVAVGASLEFLGMPVELVVVSDSPFGAEEFTHVYLRVFLPHTMQWFAVDPRSMQEFGWPAGREVPASQITAERSYGWDEEAQKLIVGSTMRNVGMGQGPSSDPFRDVAKSGPIEGEVQATAGADDDDVQALLDAQAEDRRLNRILVVVSIAAGAIGIFTALRGK